MEASPLARLSPELRNAIWEFAFTSNYAITLQTGGMQHALTKTCHQIRRETLGMYYSIARLNAHLDDGPATPLAQWLRRIGREHCLLLCEVNIWDMHMLNATLHGAEATQQLLSAEGQEDEHYFLRPMGSWLLDRGWYLKNLIVALHSMQLELQMFCLKRPGRDKPKLTSHFAIASVPSRQCSTHSVSEPHGEVIHLLAQLGFSDEMRKAVLEALARTANVQASRLHEVRVRNGRREFFLCFERASFRSVRQTFIPHDEDIIF
ncbi:hypothetical protein LTR85_000326 [Meristemomyces frigidus]|nr:hypothetical protein LTR85_000326 [Meristemomyces frigidus]